MGHRGSCALSISWCLIRQRLGAQDVRSPAPDGNGQRTALLQRLQVLQVEGLSLQKIADRLNHEGVPTLSGKGKWQKGTIGNLLAQGHESR